MSLTNPSTLALLSSTTLGGSGTFDISSIDQTYSDLLVVAIVRGTDAGSSDNFAMRFNNDSAGNYDFQQLAYFGTSTAASQATAQTSMRVSVIPAAGGTANYAATVRFEICGYSTTSWVKKVASLTNYYAETQGTPAAVNVTGVWRSTAAINRIQLFGVTTANLAANSVLRIYGRL